MSIKPCSGSFPEVTVLNEKDVLMDFSQDDILKMMDDTSKLMADQCVAELSSAAVAVPTSEALANNVQYWNWMARNYKASGIFDSPSSMQNYIAGGTGKEEWFAKQLQGKGYEYDWMTAQRHNFKNLFKTYNAGDVANRSASDVTERNLFTGQTTEYQMKAYTSKTNPHLKNTPKDMTVVTNAEKVGIVQKNEYKSVESFQDSKTIKSSTDKRLEQVKDGTAYPTYNLKNVTATMAKAGIVGCAIGIVTESFLSYKKWKSGQLSDREYITEILKSGGDMGVTATISSGIMIPVSAALTFAGASSAILLPVGIVVSAAVNQFVAPCFKRGKYRVILSNAKYYQNIMNFSNDLMNSMQESSEQYYHFVSQMIQQDANHQKMKEIDKQMDDSLRALYDSI